MKWLKNMYCPLLRRFSEKINLGFVRDSCEATSFDYKKNQMVKWLLVIFFFLLSANFLDQYVSSD